MGKANTQAQLRLCDTDDSEFSRRTDRKLLQYLCLRKSVSTKWKLWFAIALEEEVRLTKLHKRRRDFRKTGVFSLRG